MRAGGVQFEELLQKSQDLATIRGEISFVQGVTLQTVHISKRCAIRFKRTLATGMFAFALQKVV